MTASSDISAMKRERGAIKFRDDDEKPIRFAKTRLPKVRSVRELTLMTRAVSK